MNENQNITLPDKIEISRFSNYIQITFKWSKWWEALLVSVFAIFWVFLIFQLYTDITKSGIAGNLFFLFQVGFGILITYYAIAGWFNKTNILVGTSMMEINHQPIPWIGNKRLDTQKIKEFYTQEKVTHSRGNIMINYELYAIMQSGKKIKLFGGLTKVEQAIYIKQEIEKYLGIAKT